jgi:hypothetical protein
MIKKPLISIALFSAAAIALAGCATSTEDDSINLDGNGTSQESDTQNNDTAPNNDDSNEDIELVQPDIGAEDGFGLVQAITVVKATCEYALAEGVTESYVNEDGSSDGFSVLVPEEYAIDSYSAAFTDGAGNYELIFETGEFAACAFDNAISLAEEMSSEADPDAELPDTPSEVLDVIEAEDGRFLASLGGGDSQQQLFVEISYDTETNLMTSFIPVSAAGEPEGGSVELTYGYSESMLDVIEEALSATFE